MPVALVKRRMNERSGRPESAHHGDRRVGLVVHRQPFLAIVDHRIGRLPEAHQRREWLLSHVMPLQHVDLGNLHRFLQADKARDKIEREVLPARSAARHDDALRLTTQHERPIHPDPDARIVVGKRRDIAPMDGRLAIDEQSGLAEQHRTRTGAGQHRAIRMRSLQPSCFRVIPSGYAFAGIDEEIRDAHDVRLRALAEIMVRLHPDAIRGQEPFLVRATM